MSDTDRSKAWLDRVRKLLAKAEDPSCTPAEAAALNDKAAELIAKYGIEDALNAAADGRVRDVADLVIWVSNPYGLDKVELLARIAEPMRCKLIRQDWQGMFRCHLFGYQADLDRAALLYRSLVVQAAYAIITAKPDQSWGRGELTGNDLTAFRRSWMDGFSTAVYWRLHRSEERVTREAQGRQSTSDEPGTDLAIVLEDRAEKVRERVAEEYPTVRAPRDRQFSTVSGREAGYIAGALADLHQPTLGGHRTEVTPS